MKWLKYLLIGGLFLTGCSSAEKDLDKSIDEMEHLNNYHIKESIVLTKEGAGNDINKNITYEIDVNDGMAIVEKNTLYFGKSTSEKIYYDSNNKYFTYEDAWYKQETGHKFMDFNLLGEFGSIVKSDNNYNIQLNQEQLKSFLSYIDEFKNANIINAPNFSINIDNHKIKSIHATINLTIDNIEYESELVIEFSKFDEVGELTIPSEVSSNALSYDIYEKRINVDNYLDEVREDLMTNPEVKKYSNEDLTFDGIKPNKIDLNVENGIIVSGIVESDGYEAIIENGQIINFAKLN